MSNGLSDLEVCRVVLILPSLPGVEDFIEVAALLGLGPANRAPAYGGDTRSCHVRAFGLEVVGRKWHFSTYEVKDIGRKVQIWDITMASIGILEFCVPVETLFAPEYMEWLIGVNAKGARVESAPGADNVEEIDIIDIVRKKVSGTGSRLVSI